MEETDLFRIFCLLSRHFVLYAERRSCRDALCFYRDVCIGYVSGGVLQVLYVTSSVRHQNKSKRKKKTICPILTFRDVTADVEHR